MLRALTLAVLLCVAAPVTASANEWRESECRYNRGSTTWTTSEVRRTIRCAAEKWDPPGGVSKAMSVAECESHFYARAVSDSGTYRGVYQHSIHYWSDRVNSAPDWLDLETGAFNGRSNVIVSVLMARGGWSAWAGCA